MTDPVWSWRWEVEYPAQKLDVSVAIKRDAPAGLVLHAVDPAGGVVDLALDRDSAESLAQFLANWAGLL